MSIASWYCTVCGYVHRGEFPPEYCPVCGVTGERFEPAADALQGRGRVMSQQWRCLTCDYMHTGNVPPDTCQVCGAGPDQFELVNPPEQHILPQGTEGTIVIVGGGIAGLSAAESARQAAPKATITIVTRESDHPYYRLNLTRYLAGEITGNDLPVRPENWYAENSITILLDTEVTAIDAKAKKLHLKGHPDLPYDKLILALGAHPFVPAIPGVNRENVVTLRTRVDAERILARCSAGSKCVIVGGGVLGLETAAAVVLHKVQVTVVEGFEWLLPRQLTRTAGERLAKKARKLGIDLVFNAKIKEFDGDEQVRGVVLESGQILPANLVIVTAGVRSNSYLARMAGLEVNNGVVVNHHLQTSNPDIFAAGDLVEHQGTAYGTWAPAQFQGTIAGMNAVGGDVVFAGIPRSNSLKVLGAEMFIIGQIHPDDASYEMFENDGESYDFFVFRDTRMVGAILVGDTAIAPVVKKLIEAQVSCADLLAVASDAKGIRDELRKKIVR